MSAEEWYVQMRGEVIGPISSPQLRKLADDGTLRHDTPARKGEDGRWIAAGQVKGLFIPLDRRPEIAKALAKAAKGPVASPSPIKEPNRDPNSPPDPPPIAPVGFATKRVDTYTTSGSDKIPSSDWLALVDLFLDVRIKRYLTPFLLRLIWVLTLILAALLMVLSIGSFLAEDIGPYFPKSATTRSETSISSGSTVRLDQERVEALKKAFSVSAKYALVTYATICALVFVRIVLEMVIVFFNMSESLKRIEERQL